MLQSTGVHVHRTQEQGLLPRFPILHRKLTGGSPSQGKPQSLSHDRHPATCIPREHVCALREPCPMSQHSSSREVGGQGVGATTSFFAYFTQSIASFPFSEL